MEFWDSIKPEILPKEACDTIMNIYHGHSFKRIKDPVPVDGNPHPAHCHIAHANPDVPQNWMHDLAGAANAILHDIGINAAQMNEAMEDIQPHEHPAAVNNDEAELDHLIQLAEQNFPVPHHPDQPQGSTDLSSSTADFIRGTGPEILLTVEIVLARFPSVFLTISELFWQATLSLY